MCVWLASAGLFPRRRRYIELQPLVVVCGMGAARAVAAVCRILLTVRVVVVVVVEQELPLEWRLARIKVLRLRRLLLTSEAR
jgi:hypothetical protein